MRTQLALRVSSTEAPYSVVVEALRGKSLRVSAQPGLELGCPCPVSAPVSTALRVDSDHVTPWLNPFLGENQAPELGTQGPV